MNKNHKVSLITYNVYGKNKGKYTYAFQGDLEEKKKENILMNIGLELSGTNSENGGCNDFITYARTIEHMVDSEVIYENIYTIIAPFLIFNSTKAKDMKYNTYLLENIGIYSSEEELKKNYLEDYLKLLEKNINKKDETISEQFLNDVNSFADLILQTYSDNIKFIQVYDSSDKNSLVRLYKLDDVIAAEERGEIEFVNENKHTSHSNGENWCIQFKNGITISPIGFKDVLEVINPGQDPENIICEDGDDYYWKWAQNFNKNSNNDKNKNNNNTNKKTDNFNKQAQNNKNDKKSSKIDTKDGSFDDVIYKNFLFNSIKIYNNQEPDNNFLYLSYNNTKPEDVYKSFVTFYCKKFMQQNNSLSKEDINEFIDNIEKNFSIDTKQVLITVPNMYAINSLNVPDMAQNSIKEEENGGIYDTVEDFDANFAKDMKQAQNRQESVTLKDKTENLLEKTFTFISTK